MSAVAGASRAETVTRVGTNEQVTVAVGADGIYDEIDIEDMTYNEEEDAFYYPCPCGDRFKISGEELADGEEIATCPSCSLIIRVIYDPDDFVSESYDDDE